MRHPCSRGIYQSLGKVVFLAVREALNAPAHPDSKRQDRRKRRDLERYGARILKRDGVLSCPARKNSEQQDAKRIVAQFRKDELFAARILAGRLNGRVWNETQKEYIAKRLGGFYRAA